MTVSFEESKHPRAHGGRFGSKGGGAEDDLSVAMRALLGSGSPIEALKSSDDPKSLLQDIAVRLAGNKSVTPAAEDEDLHADKARRLNRRKKRREGEQDLAYGRTPYEVHDSQVIARGDHENDDDEEAYEERIEAKDKKVGPKRIVLTTFHSDDPDEFKANLKSDYDRFRNKPSFMQGEAGEEERLAVHDAVDRFVDGGGDPWRQADDGDVVQLVLNRPADSPYYKARAAAEVEFEKRGMSRKDILREMTGEADRDRQTAQIAADVASREHASAATDAKLMATYPDEARDLLNLTGREKYALKSRLLLRHKKDYGVELPY